MRRRNIWALLIITSIVPLALGDIIPFCPYARLISEDITVTLRYDSGSFVADFEGDFVLEDLWYLWGTMVFPIPDNATDFQVIKTTNGCCDTLETYWYMYRDYSVDGYPMVQQYYSTVLPEMPLMPIKLWNSPSEGAESFHVSYTHELISRGNQLIFIYALGVEDFPNPRIRKVALTGETLMRFDILLPEGLSVADIFYDCDMGDSYIIEDGHLILTPAGPYHKDIIVTFNTVYESTSLAGDANEDGFVNLEDFIILKQNFGTAQATWSQGDFNGDGDVDVKDFITLKHNYGATSDE